MSAGDKAVDHGAAEMHAGLWPPIDMACCARWHFLCAAAHHLGTVMNH
jgi:hypothetical protein